MVNKNTPCGALCFVSAPTGIRTPVVALKGLRPSPLDDGGNLSLVKRADFIILPYNGQAIGLLITYLLLPAGSGAPSYR